MPRALWDHRDPGAGDSRAFQAPGSPGPGSMKAPLWGRLTLSSWKLCPQTGGPSASLQSLGLKSTLSGLLTPCHVYEAKKPRPHP